MQQASYLEGRPLMWMLPLYLHVNQKSDDDDDDDDEKEEDEEEDPHCLPYIQQYFRHIKR